jgi:DNA-binding NarL/FixJ family response regulator
MFKLTRAEANAIVALANGMTVNEIAEAKNISQDTVRSQLKIIFRKTDAYSHADLVRL